MFSFPNIAIALQFAALATVFCYSEAVTEPVGNTSAVPAELIPTKPATLTQSPSSAETANPLWTVSLDSLPQTRERPLFSPSRRPPPPLVVITPAVPLVIAPKPAAPDRLRLLLIGTVLGEQNIALLREEKTDTLLRLHAGQDHEGWILRRIARREVKFEKGNDTAVLALSNPVSEQMLRIATADKRSHAITRFAMPTPQPDADRRCLSGLKGRTLPGDTALCAVGRARALFHTSSQ